MRWKRATVSVWVYEKTWPMWSEPDTVGGGVSMEKTCGPGGRPVEGVGPLRFPPGRPGGLEALQAGLLRDSRSVRRPRRWVRFASLAMIGLPYPACSSSTTPPPARWRPCASGSPAGCRCTCAGRPSTTRPISGHGRFSLVFDVLRRYLLFTGLEVTYVSNITDIDDKIIDRAAERGIPESRAHRHLRGGVVGGHGRPGRAPSRPDPPRHRLRGPDGRTGRPTWSGGAWPTRPTTASTCRSWTSPATGCWPTSPSTRCGPGPGWRPTTRSARLSTSCCGRRPSRASRPGRRPGARVGPDGTPSAW